MGIPAPELGSPTIEKPTERGETHADLALVRAVLAGEENARRTFAQRMRCVSRILAVRNRRLGRPLGDDELADLAQETVLAVWRKLDRYSGRAALETWVYRFCSFELLNALRKKERLSQALADLSQVRMEEEANLSTTPGDEACVAGYLRHLSTREADVVRLRHFEQLEVGQIAEVLNISKSSVKTHYYRALEKLRGIVHPTRGKE